MSGYVYLLKQNKSNFLKIGFSSDLPRRLKEYNTHNIDYVLLYLIKSDASLEKELHQKFSDYKIKGEWFHNKIEIIDYFKNHPDAQQVAINIVFDYKLINTMEKINKASLHKALYFLIKKYMKTGTMDFKNDESMASELNLNARVARNALNELKELFKKMNVDLKDLVKISN